MLSCFFRKHTNLHFFIDSLNSSYFSVFSFITPSVFILSRKAFVYRSFFTEFQRQNPNEPNIARPFPIVSIINDSCRAANGYGMTGNSVTAYAVSGAACCVIADFAACHNEGVFVIHADGALVFPYVQAVAIADAIVRYLFPAIETISLNTYANLRKTLIIFCIKLISSASA